MKCLRILFIFLLIGFEFNAQNQNPTMKDNALKEQMYLKYKKEVQHFDKNDFDALFLDFFQKVKNKNLTLSKEEYYSYTIKIAIYSEKQGLLYREKRKESEVTKKEWFEKDYTEYLKNK
jgi:glycosylphosphatidylinositol transamidase (GPIT) subunit GPI8